MRCQNKLKLILAIFILFGVLGAVNATEITITTKNNAIKIGEPLILDVTYTFSTPQADSSSGEIAPSIVYENLLLQVENMAKDEEKMIYIPKISIFQNDSQGLIYSGEVFIWYNTKESSIAFNSVDSYYITLLASQKLMSNTLSLMVIAASVEEQQVLTELSDPNDCIFLCYGVSEKSQKPKRYATLDYIVEEYPNTLIAKWSAARLGLEYFRGVQKKYPSNEKLRKLLKQDQIQEPLFEKAYQYLGQGAFLPDDFPIRREVLLNLSVAEFIKDDLPKATSILDELAAKYPNSECGKRAVEGKIELQNFKKEKQGQKPRDV